MKLSHTDAGIVSDTDLCLTKDGEVVERSDPQAHAVLINAGKVIPPEMVQRHGLRPAKVGRPPKDDEKPDNGPSVKVDRSPEPSTEGKHGSVTIHKR